MAYFKIRKNVFNDPPTLGAVQRTFKTVEKYEPFVDGIYDWFKVNGPGIPDDSVEIELAFQLTGPNHVNLTWTIKK